MPTMITVLCGRREYRKMPPIRWGDKQFTAYENSEYDMDGKLIDRWMTLSPCVIIGWHYVPESAWH